MKSEKKLLNKLLYVAMRFDYGRPSQGTSFEFNNFYRTLVRMIPQVVEFDFMTVMQQTNREAMNQTLLHVAEREQPDLIFFCLFTDEIRPSTIAALSRQWITFNWFCDDHWRFHNFSRHYAPQFSFVSTTDASAIQKYERIGYHHALLTQWACNEKDYVKLHEQGKTIAASFVGQPHGNRRSVVRYLERNGIKVAPYGNGWPNGRISQEEMIRIFNISKINLNLSNSSWNLRTIFRNQQQIKGRNFEIPGCGGFILTNYVEGIERYFVLDKEIVCFSNRRDLLEKVRYYLAHDEERSRIAQAGYERTLRDHTYEIRFRELFQQMGFVL